MNTRALLAIVVVVAMATVPLSVLADGSDADDGFSTYYTQLTDGQKAIYASMTEIPAETELKPESNGPDGTETIAYKIQVTSTYVVAATSSDAAKDLISEDIVEDAIRAYQACKLDNPMAFWTWSEILPTIDDEALKIVESGNEVYKVTSFTLNLGVSKDYYSGDGKSMAEKITATKDALADIEIKSEKTVDKVKEINELLCGSGYEYDPAVQSGSGEECAFDHSLYGALVHEEDGKHVIVCDGYASLFKALCDKYDVPCVTVVGWAVDSDGFNYHAWNAVEMEGKVYAVDSTWNATGSNDEAYLAVGANTTVDGATFAQSHQAFLAHDESSDSIQYHFAAPVLSDGGYEWPEKEDILTNIASYAPWIMIALISVLLAYVLISMGRKGE